MDNFDPKGYYQTLGVAHTASAHDIKTAYRVRANEAHPDKNPNRDTTAEFQLVAEAYSVLSDPLKRAQYDASARRTPSPSRTDAESPPDPIRCSSCNAVSAQPRYVIFLEVVSYLFATTKSGVQGIFCPRCALKRGLKASLITWLAGWWGFPWGPIYSIEALLKNLLGGTVPPDVNAKILGYQAWWFATTGRVDLARSLAVEAIKLATKAKDHSQVGILGKFLSATDDGRPVAELRSRWGFVSPTSFSQVVLAVAVIGAVWAVSEWQRESSIHDWEQLTEARRAQRIVASAPHTQSDLTPNAPPLTVAPVPNIPPEPTPENGNFTSYWTGRPLLLAPFRVVAPSGDQNVFVKLVNAETNAPLITLFVRAGQTADVDVPIGRYRMKYAAGSVWYGVDALFGPDTTYMEADQTLDFYVKGNELVGKTIELTLRPSGNLKTSHIDPSAF